jgi:hypothetical protein
MTINSYELIRKHFNNAGFNAGDEIFIPISSREAFIQAVKEKGFAVIEIEGFEIDPIKKSVRPLPVLKDFSNRPGPWNDFMESSNKEAEAFLKKIESQPNTYFSFIVANETEWKKF